jgi:hypothetical protein
MVAQRLWCRLALNQHPRDRALCQCRGSGASGEHRGHRRGRSQPQPHQLGYSGYYDSWIASVTPSITAGQADFPTDIAPEATRQSSAAFYCAECR